MTYPYQIQRQEYIAQVLTTVSHLSVQDEVCPICRQHFAPSTRPQDPTQHCKQPENYQCNNPVRLPCNHVFGKLCIIHWLNVRGTCPQCRARILPDDASRLSPHELSLDLTPERHNLANWGYERLRMLDILSQMQGWHARRVQDYILRESTVGRMPTAALWCVFWCLTARPGDMTNAKLVDLVREWEGLLREEMLREEMLREEVMEEWERREFEDALGALRRDIALHSGKGGEEDEQG